MKSLIKVTTGPNLHDDDVTASECATRQQQLVTPSLECIWETCQTKKVWWDLFSHLALYWKFKF